MPWWVRVQTLNFLTNYYKNSIVLMISHQQGMYFLLTIVRSLLLTRDPSSQCLCYVHVSLGLLIVLGIVVRFLHLIHVHLVASEFHCVFIHFKQTSYGLIGQGWFEGYQKIKIIFTNQDLSPPTIRKAVTPRQWRETNRLKKIRPVLPVRCERCVFVFMARMTKCHVLYTVHQPRPCRAAWVRL